MNSTSKNQNNGFVECEICLKEIPVSEARSEEATEYVTYYFGLECYQTWRTQKHKTSEKVNSQTSVSGQQHSPSRP